MNMQDVSNLVIPEGNVRTIHDSSNNQLWGKVAYDTKYKGNTTQQTYSGFQLLEKQGLATSADDSSFWNNLTNIQKTDLSDGWSTFASTASASHNFFIKRSGGFDWEVDTTYTVIVEIKNAPSVGVMTLAQPQNSSDPFASTSVGGQVSYFFTGHDDVVVFSGVTKSATTSVGLRSFLNSAFVSSVTLRLTIVKGNHVSDYQNYIGDNYEPYTAGPAPNPDYPQTVNVVTGTQTLTLGDGVNTDDYTLSLGSVELCKIGSYQDYIYKSGGDWYLHKEFATRTIDENTTYTSIIFGSTNTIRISYSGTSPKAQPEADGVGISPYLQWKLMWSKDEQGFYANGITFVLRLNKSIVGTTEQSFLTWLASNPLSFYYAIETPTNTKITDTTLISQLEAIDEWMTRYGYNATVTGNLPIIVDRSNL